MWLLYLIAVVLGGGSLLAQMIAGGDHGDGGHALDFAEGSHPEGPGILSTRSVIYGVFTFGLVGTLLHMAGVVDPRTALVVAIGSAVAALVAVGYAFQKRIVDAQTRRAAMIAESEGQVAAQIAQVTAEIERQKVRALQVKRQLDADVVQLAEADRRAREEEARGQAARFVERGRAEAMALKSVFEAYAAAGEGAREVMMLQQVMPLLAQVAGATHRLEIEKVTVLPGGAGDGGFARAAISASEQIKAATGFDLAAAAERLGQSDREGGGRG